MWHVFTNQETIRQNWVIVLIKEDRFMFVQCFYLLCCWDMTVQVIGYSVCLADVKLWENGDFSWHSSLNAEYSRKCTTHVSTNYKIVRVRLVDQKIYKSYNISKNNQTVNLHYWFNGLYWKTGPCQFSLVCQRSYTCRDEHQRTVYTKV